MFEEALKSFRRGATLFPSGSGNGQLAQQRIAETERLIELDARLTEVLAGKGEPASPSEKIQLAGLAQQPYRALYSATVSLYSEAFAARPALEVSHRYDAACAAALAGGGQGADGDKLSAPKRARLRQQARAWLQADLAVWAGKLEGGAAKDRAQVKTMMRHWQADADLAGVRDREALARLPKEERQGWQKLWDEVDSLIRRANEPD
jgi:hypothetical protein